MAATPETKTARPDTECQARRFRFFCVGTERTKHAQSKTYATNGVKGHSQEDRKQALCCLFFDLLFFAGFPNVLLAEASKCSAFAFDV